MSAGEPRPAVVIGSERVDDRPAALALAARLGLPYVEGAACDGLQLRITTAGLQLAPRWHGAPGPISVDFTNREALRRSRNSSELLIRALGGAARGSRIIDSTAGLGRDTWVLAGAGYSVTAVERNPVLHAMLEEALARAARYPELRSVVERVHLLLADARGLLEHGSGPAPAVVLLDPMFPLEARSAQVRKEMCILRRLVGDDPDAVELLQFAQRAATRRVIVKRMKTAPPLLDPPDASVREGTIRFDVYRPAR